MKSLKVDENGFKWMKMVKMDEFLATRMFFWVQISPKIGQRLKKLPSGEISPV
jgi:hypothetical protein